MYISVVPSSRVPDDGTLSLFRKFGKEFITIRCVISHKNTISFISRWNPEIGQEYNTPLTAGVDNGKSQGISKHFLLCLSISLPNAPYYLIRYLFLSEGRAGGAWERSNLCSVGCGGTTDETVLAHCVVCEGFKVTADAVHGYYRIVKG